MGNVGSERGTCRDDGGGERENACVSENSSENGANSGCGRAKMVNGGEKMVDVAERRRRVAGRRR